MDTHLFLKMPYFLSNAIFISRCDPLSWEFEGMTCNDAICGYFREWLHITRLHSSACWSELVAPRGVPQ